MNKILGYGLLVRARYDAMEPKEQASAIWNLSIDIVVLLFLVLMIYVGLTKVFSAFYVWVPLLIFLAWFRLKQARKRWSL